MQTDAMPKEEFNQAINALMAWFQSQDINPVDAVAVMSGTCGHIIGRKAKNLDILMEYIGVTANCIGQLAMAAFQEKSKSKPPKS